MSSTSLFGPAARRPLAGAACGFAVLLCQALSASAQGTGPVKIGI